MAATFQMNMFQAESNERQATETPKATPMTEKKPKVPKQAAPAAAQSKIKAPAVPGNDLTAEEEAKALSDWLNHHAHSYYNLDKPMTSDGQYDLVKQRLITLENQHPESRDPNSPTQRVGGVADGQFQQVRHEHPCPAWGTSAATMTQAWHARAAAALNTLPASSPVAKRISSFSNNPFDSVRFLYNSDDSYR